MPHRITLKSSFAEILGRKDDVFPESVRRSRWARWLRLARRRKQSKVTADVWIKSHECAGCIHRRGAWCTLMGLPCTVNPILSFSNGIPGMACMGAGREERK